MTEVSPFPAWQDCAGIDQMPNAQLQLHVTARSWQHGYFRARWRSNHFQKSTVSEHTKLRCWIKGNLRLPQPPAPAQATPAQSRRPGAQEQNWWTGCPGGTRPWARGCSLCCCRYSNTTTAALPTPSLTHVFMHFSSFLDETSIKPIYIYHGTGWDTSRLAWELLQHWLSPLVRSPSLKRAVLEVPEGKQHSRAPSKGTAQ